MGTGKYAPYAKIADSSARWQLDEAAFRSLRRIPWIVTEKIHGAHFCFVTDGATVRCANRRQFLESGDDFFGYQTVAEALEGRTRQAFHCAARTRSGLSRLFVYGELFGGHYPHPDVPPAASSVQPIQTGVWYAPDIRFRAFDIMTEASGAEPVYIDHDEAAQWCEAARIPYATPLFTGRWEEAMTFPIRFDSTVPRALGLPPLPPGTNSAEGVIVRPRREILIATERGPVRPLLKRKIPEFAEDRRFHEARKWPEQTTPPGGGALLDLLRWEAYCRVTENRRDAVLSKIGGRSGSLLFALLVDEIMDEVRDTNSAAFTTLTPTEQAELLLFTRQEVRTLLRQAS